MLDLSSWDDIVEIDAANMQVIVRPGIIHARLNENWLNITCSSRLIPEAARCVPSAEW